ncbi:MULTISPECIES: hypothetical protein [unclassified Streptomyces]|uniref:hypothetical protein n=1 Tax=unclassified Streptomyces TaxID=2593676 RepID=UPI0013A6C585|nr:MULTISPECIES: hypothetical protein [unclassified Streptomyces]
MRRIARAGAALALALGAVATVGAVGAEAAVQVRGCPAGTACLYGEGGSWPAGRPSLVMYPGSTYFPYPQMGTLRVLNNRDAGLVRVCGPVTGTPGGCVDVLPHGWVDVVAPTMIAVMI